MILIQDLDEGCKAANRKKVGPRGRFSLPPSTDGRDRYPDQSGNIPPCKTLIGEAI